MHVSDLNSCNDFFKFTNFSQVLISEIYQHDDLSSVRNVSLSECDHRILIGKSISHSTRELMILIYSAEKELNRNQ